MLRKRGGDRRDAEDCSRSDEKEFFHRSGSFLGKVGAAGGFLIAAQPMEPERGSPGCGEIFSQKTAHGLREMKSAAGGVT
jgi:hypothetical protein